MCNIRIGWVDLTSWFLKKQIAFAISTTEAEYIQRISLTGFPAQSVGSSNTEVLDSPCLLVLITRMAQSRQHESRKSPTVELFDVDSGRISIHHCEYLRASL
ncbi:hypothetical protein Tco_0669102 [Tanacetum coccineum]